MRKIALIISMVSILIGMTIVFYRMSTTKDIDWNTFGSDIQQKVEEKVQNAGLPEIQRCKPIHEAAKNGNVLLVKELIQKGANVNEIGCFWQMTPLQTALFDDKEVIPLEQIGIALADFKVTGDTDRLVKALAVPVQFSGNKDNAYTVVQLLLERGARSSLEHKQDKFGNTALHIAALFDHNKTVSLLCQYGAYKDALNTDEVTPLYVACSNKHIFTVQALIKAGANVNIRMRNPLIPLKEDLQPMAIHLATALCSVEMVKLFLDSGQNVDSTNGWGQTPLHYAAMSLDEPMMKFLIQRGARLDIKDSCGIDPKTGKELCGYSPLGYAARALKKKNPSLTNEQLAQHPIVKLLQYKKE